jgi:hypothetical protein
LSRTNLARVLLFPAFAAALSLAGQNQPNSTSSPSPIATDRPAFTDSSVVVPQGSLQFENGFLETTEEGQQGFDFPETLARFGVAAKTELRLIVPDYYQNTSTTLGFGSGWGDLALGLKQQLGPIRGFDVSLVLSLSVPTGSRSISSHGYDPQIQLPWSRQISANWTAAGMFSLSWPTQGPQRNLTGQGTFLMDRQLTKPWDAFIEYAGNFPQRGGSQQYLHFGTAYKLTAQQQLDFHVGVGLSSAAVDHFIGFGYSFRFLSAFRK